ncbi:hypothetical protein V8C44DRAFT_170042 [Trichoderma aethiopicum]
MQLLFFLAVVLVRVVHGSRMWLDVSGPSSRLSLLLRIPPLPHHHTHHLDAHGHILAPGEDRPDNAARDILERGSSKVCVDAPYAHTQSLARRLDSVVELTRFLVPCLHPHHL